MPRPRVTEPDTVLDAAARSLAAQGIAETSIDDVAEVAGVSRATVYRYVGDKNEVVQAVIFREAEHVLARVAAAISASTAPHEAIVEAVATALTAIAENPVLARLTSSDLRETLPFITTDADVLVERCVSTLSDAMRTAPELSVDDSAVEHAIEESTRFVLAHLTTPRRDGSRLSTPDAATRAALLIAPMLSPTGAED